MPITGAYTDEAIAEDSIPYGASHDDNESSL